jgi:signal transduction histidine kinase
MGDFPAAIEQARSTHQAATALGDRQAAATTLEIWAKASGGQLPPEPITAALREAGVDIQTASALLQAQAVHLRAQGRRDEAIRYAEEAVTLPRRLRTMNMYLVPALPLVTTLYREAAEEPSLPGPRRRLLRRAARAGRRARRYAVVYRNELPHALREQAMIAALRGRSRRARRLFKASLGQAEQRGARAEMAETLQLRARVGGRLGWPGSAADQTRCDELFEDINPDGPLARREPTLGLAERFDALLAAGGPLVSAGSSEEIATAVEEAVMVLLRPEQCRVVGIGPGRDANLDDERDRSMSGTRLVQRAMEERRPVVLSGLDDDDQSGDSIALAGARSALCAPIVVGNESLGYLLAWHSRVTGLFGDEEQRLAQFIAHLAGAALWRERLQQRMRAGVVAAQEAERARVARDLHDEIGQALTSVLLGVRLVQTSLGAEPLDRKHLLERTDEVRQVATDALGDVQRLAFELRPTVLDDLGLIPALRRLVGEISSRHPVTVDFVVSHLAPGDRLAPDVETTAYRVVQEALTNVVRHAQASTCSVLLARVQNRLRLVVEDNGIGYEVTQTREGGLGLRGISERAALVGGIVRITSSPGEGTVVAMEVPVG